MLDKYWLRKLDRQALGNYREFKCYDLDLTNRRLEKMKAKQAANPDFKAYDKWADGMVDIATRIEEHTFVREDILDDLAAIDDRMIELDKIENLGELRREHPGGKILKYDIGNEVVQLSLFEGVPA